MPTPKSFAVAAALATVAALLPNERSAPAEITLDRDDIEITSDVVVKPGRYRVVDKNGDGVLHVRRDGVTIDFRGASLDGAAEGVAADAFDGVGIAISDAARVTVKNATLCGFRVGIDARNAAKLRIEQCDVGRMRRMRLRSTPEREDEVDWLSAHENDREEWGRYGAGIWLRDCADAWVVANRARASQNGLYLDRCARVRVHDNDFSFLSGWGLAMWRSSKNEIAHNKFDWCVRGYSHGVYDRGQDSAGILVFEQCSENVFAFNSATHGGDGFFLYAGNETLQQTGAGGCNKNVLYRNDFSHAVANGIEATFSDSNVFAENRLDDCSQHGIWGGYSYRTTIVNNQIADAGGGGISIEHGHDNWIEGNVLERCATAIELWANEKEAFADKPYGKQQETHSMRTTIVRNVLRENPLAARIARSSEIAFRWNLFDRNARGIVIQGACPKFVLEKNVFRIGEKAPEHFVRNETGSELVLGSNAWGGVDPAPLVGPRVKAGPDLAPAPTIDPKESNRHVAPPKVGGALEAMLPEGALRGRKWILVDEWGPYDFVAPRAFPTRAFGAGEVKVTLAGPPKAFEVIDVPEGVVVEPRRGTLPATLRVAMAPEATGLRVFHVAARVEGVAEPLQIEATLLRAKWRVAFRRWDAKTEDPRKLDAAAWKRFLEGAPVDSLETDAIDFRWGGGAPTPKVGADHFVTVAETELDVPADAYEIRTVSDDGVRVLVDGRVVQEDWTWHGAKENAATVELTAGRHAVRVEHFEIDGATQLAFTLRPATKPAK